MNWKNWPYWVKGGVSTGLFCLVTILIAKLEIFNSLLNIIAIPAFVLQTFLSVPILLLLYPIVGINSVLLTHEEFGDSLTGTGQIVEVIVYFIIGSLLGALYGKIKNRNKIPSSTFS